MRRGIWLLLPLLLAALACDGLPFGTGTPLPPPAASDTPTSVVQPSPTTPVAGAATPTAVAPANEATPTVEPNPTADASATAAEPEQPGFIAYVREGQLLVTDVSGGAAGGTTQYTMESVDDQVTDLVWSPSGEFIAYTGLVGEVQHVFYVYALGAGSPVDLGPGAVAAWSPDSTQVAYQNEGNLWVTAVDSPEPRQLTFQENWAWGRPVFTPDGSALIAAGESFDNMGASGNTSFWLYTVPLDGSGTLTPLPGLEAPIEGRLPYDLRFSPDGEKLSFSTSFHLNACASLASLSVLEADGSGLRSVLSPSLQARVNDDQDDHLTILGYAWTPESDALLVSGLVRDCTDFSGEVIAGPQMSLVTLGGEETMVVPGYFASPSFDRTGQHIGAALYGDPSQVGHVQVYDREGQLVLEVGEGDMPKLQP